MIVQLPDKSTLDIRGEQCTIEELLDRLAINTSEVVVSVNGRITPEDAFVGGDDRIRIIRVAHGG